MADLLEQPDPNLPPPAEAIHMPEPSYLPAVTALGVAIALIGVITTWVLSAIGGVIALAALFRWIRRTRDEMAELPLEHH
jgi:hypothetical protein